MIAGLKLHPAMKDSGVPWLGEVPEHWEVRRLGDSTQGCINGIWGGEPNGRDDLTCVRVADFDRWQRRVKLRKPTMRAIEKAARANRLLRRGDLLLEKSGGGDLQPVGVVVLYDHDIPAVCSNFVARVPVARGFDPTYLCYLHAHLYAIRLNTRSIKQTTGIQNLDASAYLREPVAFPTLPEQAAIVRFLDHADRRIRRYIRAKQKLIKLLEEQKQAITHRAVTRGLDPNVRLKPSGVEWLGDVPEHWEVLPLCAVGRPRKQTNQPHRELLSVYLGRGVIPFSAIEEKRTNPTSEDLSKYQAVEPGDFVLNNQQAWRGSVGVSRHQGIVSPAYLVLALDGRLLVEFADRLLPGRAMVAQYLVTSKGVGSIQRNLYWPHLRRVAVLVPPTVDQVAITRYVEDATASLATTIERTGREIDLLREYRTRLIADVVTGKLDVREAAARLPDEGEEPEPFDEIEAEGDPDDAGVDDADAVPEEAEA